MEIDGINIELIKIKQTGVLPLVTGIDSNDEMLISRLGKFNRAKYGEMLTNLNSNSQFLGTITPSSTIPAQGNVWGFAGEGTYPNAGNITVATGKFAILSRVGTTWSKVEVALPNAEIATWTPNTFISGAQVIHEGRMYQSNAGTVAGDVPGVSPKWNIILG